MTIKTEKTVARVKPILDYGFEHMLAHDQNLPSDFETRLREHLGTTYKELKPMMIELTRHPHYIYVAIRYMESAPSFTGITRFPAAEFRRHLAKAYGIKTLSMDTIDEDRKTFWSHWPEDLEDE